MHMVRRLRSGTERIPTKKFCGIPRESDFLWCEMPTVLSGLFFLIINCLFTCFDRIGALSIKGGCHIMSARGTGNFGILFLSSGNRHKFTSMFNCASLVHPCTSVACCQTKFPVPLTALIRHPYFDERYHYSVKHGKDCFYHKKKNEPLRTVVFHHPKNSLLEYRKTSLPAAPVPFRNRLTRIR